MTLFIKSQSRTTRPAGMWRLALAMTFSILGATSLPLAAQPASPQGPIHVIVPHPAGGPADRIGRITANTLAKGLAIPVLVENQPNGNTLLANASVHVIYPAVFKQVGFDVIDDFTPVSLLTRVPMVLLVNPQVPAYTVQELVAYAKADPGKLAFGSSGNAGDAHLAGELFEQMAGIDLVHVPYRGAAPAMNDLIGGQVQVMFNSASSSLQFVRTGKLRAHAVTSESRLALMPDWPAMIEAGIPGYVLPNCYGLWAPRGTPVAIATRLPAEAARAFKAPDIATQLRDSGAEFVTTSPDEFARFTVSEKEKWTQIVSCAGAMLD